MSQPVSIRPSDSSGDHVDWPSTLARLDRLLRIRTTPIGMKLFETVEEMEAVERIRRPSDIHTADQIVSMASRLNWTVGITGADLVGSQCQAVLGPAPKMTSGIRGAIWLASGSKLGKSATHQAAMDVVPVGRYAAMAVSPWRLGGSATDIAMVYLNPAQMILLINGLQWAGYRKLDWGCVGESACADSWGRALTTGEPSLSIPCYAERRYGGVPDDELLMALRPDDLVRAIDGMEALSRNGLRYPIPPYGIQTDARAGLGVSYG